MTKHLLKLYRMYPKIVWNLTFITFVFIARKTIFNVQRESGDYSASVDSATSLAMIGIALAIIYINGHLRSMRKVILSMPFLFLFFMFSWSSFLWAGFQNTFVTITFKSLENIVNYLLIGMIALNIKDSKKMMYFIILYATSSTCMCLIQNYRSFGLTFYHTNSYTITAFTGLLLSLGCVKYRIFKVKELLVPMVICGYSWLTGTSTASYISALIGILVLLASRKKGINATATIVVIVFVGLLWWLASDVVYHFIAGNHTEEAMRTGTGRDVLWEGAINSWKESPWFGKGFIVGETGLGKSKQISAHNSFLSALVNTGIIGVLIFSVFVYRWVVRSYMNSVNNIYANITFPVIIAICVNLNSCPVLGSHWSFVTDTMMLVVAATFINFTGFDVGDKRPLSSLMANSKKI